MQPDYLIGLDLGQARDYSALAVVERVWKSDADCAGRLVSHYAIRHLRRWPLQTSYTAVAADLAGLVRTPPLSWPVLVVDQTGVGQAVVDFLAKAQLSASLEPVVITSGHGTSWRDGRAWHVPKKELVSCLQMLLQSRRLQVAALPERMLLMQELLAFRVKITAAANETFEAWRERDHDDLVLAVALAAWWGERNGGSPFSAKLDAVTSAHLSLAKRRRGPSAADRRGLFGRDKRSAER
jgi:hypothetical protein